MFKAHSPIITVDGFTNPDQHSRFCLGALTNSHRNSTIVNTRAAIRHGIQLAYINGELWVTNHSSKSIFVHSLNLNKANNVHPSAVYKIEAATVAECPHTVKIFDGTLLAIWVYQSIPHGFKQVLELTNMCTIQLSFVKGWGGNYPRQSVTATPCWIEIHLDEELKRLNKVLEKMDLPNEFTTSC